MSTLPTPPAPGRDEDRLFYGYRLRTEVPLPSLPILAENGAPDLTLRRGWVPDRLPDAVWASPFVEIAADGAVLIRIPGILAFLIRDGRHVTLDQDSDAATGVIETFLFSVGAGAVLHQRGVLPLHASCVMIGDVAVAMAGVSGRGKSTLAGLLSMRGHEVVTDDVCPVVFHETKALVVPGPPRLRLWPDAADLLGLSPGDLQTGRPDHPKRVLAARGAEGTPKPLGAVVRIGIDNRLEAPVLSRLTGHAAITPIEDLVYRARLGRRLDRRVGLFQDLVRLAALVPLYQMSRPDGPVDPSLLADLIASTVVAKGRDAADD
ncbi:Hpr(Ser) kinase/phosphatase [Rhodospirillum rubrum F11]|nr:HPr kinase [Rhodospirillum rubrum]AEO49561.1 Hpr(Ser) kinase/phosphatase [Rhodospirillum rubrum F11]QXG79768.1 serine kinase [Rhodospirillum rubrum]